MRNPQVFALGAAAIFMVSMDATVIVAAFSALRACFAGSSPATLSWTINGYTIVYAALLVPPGRWVDRGGVRRLLLDSPIGRHKTGVMLPLRLVAASLLICCGGAAAFSAEPLRGVVLVIADGTSQEMIAATRAYAKGPAGHLALEEFPYTAIVRTRSLSDHVTDSAAGATAMARGIKADNTVLGMPHAVSAEGPPSLLDVARQEGWSTAVVTDDAVTGATPAAFLVEHGKRDEQALIAEKILSQLGARADVVVGGGRRWLGGAQPDGTKPDVAEQTEKNASRLGGADVAFFDDGRAFIGHAERGGDARPVLAALYPEEFPFYADGKRALRLRDLVEATTKILAARGRPFFLMVEAALPDKASHRNQAKRAMAEVLELDETILWLRKNPGLLIVATTDHNNGGFAFSAPAPVRLKGDALLRKDPVTGVSRFSWATGPGALPGSNEGKDETDPDFAQPALFPSGSSAHSGGDVWLVAAGPGSEAFHGTIENTRIYELLAAAIRGPKAGPAPR